MAEATDLLQLRKLNLELLRKLTAGQETMRRLVAKVQAASGSSLDSGSGYATETPSSREVSSLSLSTSPTEGAHPGDACQGSEPSSAGSRTSPLPTSEHQYQESLSPGTPHPSPLLSTADSREPDSSDLEDLEFLDARAHQSNLTKKATVQMESPMPASSWRLRPYLGYDWIAGSLDTRSPASSKSEAFFSQLQRFREANPEECYSREHESLFRGIPAAKDTEEAHECIYCYRVNPRLFLVPSDPDSPCRLCRKPRSQQDPSTLEKPAQVRVSVPLAVLEPPHRPRIHRRKSFDDSDTLALSRHCLLGWDALPPKPEQSCTAKSLDLHAYVPLDLHSQKLPDASSALAPHLPPDDDPAPETQKRIRWGLVT